MASALVVGCGGAMPRLPSQGGQSWCELQTENVTLWTDAPFDRARPLLQALELRRQVITHAMNDAPAEARMFVVALDHDRDLATYLPPRSVAHAFGPEFGTLEPTVIIPTRSKLGQVEITHEIAHVVSWSLINRQPRWLGEGLAVYFENIELDHEPTTVTIGMPRGTIAGAVVRGEMWRLSDLLRCWGPRCTELPFYAASWALVSYLINEQGDAFARYLYELDLNEDVDCKSARECTEIYQRQFDDTWRRAFGDVDSLEGKLRAWLRNGNARFPQIDVDTKALPATERLLSDADVLAVHAFLALVGRGDRARALRLLARARSLEPTHLLSNLLDFRVHEAIAPGVARSVVNAHPDDWRAHWLLAYTLRKESSGAAAAAQLCHLRPKLRDCAARSKK